MPNDLSRYQTRLGIDDEAFAAMLRIDVERLEALRLAPSTKELPQRIQKQLQALPCNLPFHRARHAAPPFRFIDLFAGIGGMRLPFHLRGGECVLTSERDAPAKATYAANFGEAPEGSGDITQIRTEDVPAHDLLLAGFPCQAFSQAGKKEGFYDTRGTMFFEIQRFLAARKPKAFLLENVKQLRGHNGGSALRTILAVLRGDLTAHIPYGIAMSDEARESLTTPLPYAVDYRVLRARDFGVPQNRERIYIVGVRKDVAPPGRALRFIGDMFDRIEGAKNGVDGVVAACILCARANRSEGG